MDINEKELQNVNKGDRQGNKHVEIWSINAFDEWCEF
jgi:hypothetical protein